MNITYFLNCHFNNIRTELVTNLDLNLKFHLANSGESVSTGKDRKNTGKRKTREEDGKGEPGFSVQVL